MGMSGFESCLEELICSVFVELIQEGCVGKIDDDLDISSDTSESALDNCTTGAECDDRHEDSYAEGQQQYWDGYGVMDH